MDIAELWMDIGGSLQMHDRARDVGNVEEGDVFKRGIKSSLSIHVRGFFGVVLSKWNPIGFSSWYGRTQLSENVRIAFVKHPGASPGEKVLLNLLIFVPRLKRKKGCRVRTGCYVLHVGC